MLGFILGTACLIGFIKTACCGRRCGPAFSACRGGGCCGGGSCRGGGCGGGGSCDGGSCGGGHGYDHGGPCGHHHGFGFHGGPFGHRGGPRAFFLRRLFERLDATPGQEKVIFAALEELHAAALQQRGELSKSHADLAKALRSPGFDEALLGELFSRHDTVIEALRRAFVGALAKVHEALDERQRSVLAELVEAGPFGGGWVGGPFRSWM